MLCCVLRCQTKLRVDVTRCVCLNQADFIMMEGWESKPSSCVETSTSSRLSISSIQSSSSSNSFCVCYLTMNRLCKQCRGWPVSITGLQANKYFINTSVKNTSFQGIFHLQHWQHSLTQSLSMTHQTNVFAKPHEVSQISPA